MNNIIKFSLIAGVIVLMVWGISVAAKKGNGANSSTTSNQTVPAKRSEILQVQADDTIRGDKSAPITIIDYADYQCPYCVTYDKTLKQVIQAYPGQVKWIYRDYPLPFHRAARGASLAALAAGKQGKYWEMSDKIVENSQPDGAGLSDGDLAKYAAEIGLNVDQWKQDLASKTILDKIEYTINTGNTLGIRGTPSSYLVNKDGTVEELPGAMSFDALKVKIDSASAK